MICVFISECCAVTSVLVIPKKMMLVAVFDENLLNVSMFAKACLRKRNKTENRSSCSLGPTSRRSFSNEPFEDLFEASKITIILLVLAIWFKYGMMWCVKPKNIISTTR